MKARLSGDPRIEIVNGNSYWVQAYYTPSGKRTRVTAKSARAAKQLAKERLATELRDKAIAHGYTTFEKFAAKYISNSSVGRDGDTALGSSTIDGYESYLRCWINPQLGPISLCDIDKARMREFRNYLIANCPSRSTAKHALNLAKAILGYAVLLDAVFSNPAQGVKIKLDWSEQEDMKTIRIPSDQEIADLDEMARSLYRSDDIRIARTYRRYYPLFLILRMTGGRISECLGLQWSDFGVGFSAVTVKRKVDRVRKNKSLKERVGKTKTRNARRTIPIPQSVRPALAEWRLACPATNEGWVFPTRTGQPLDYNNVKNKFWKPLLKRVNDQRRQQLKPPITDHGLHGLRHFFVSVLVRAGRIKEASVLAGHSSVAFTLDHYGHLIPGDQQTLDEVTKIVAQNLIV
ncbi:site-specific integrase [Ruegeria sp. 6PALISEP08]|uniref:tyrosine-type recombinase/integrase n=1 Tax=Ruegeria sp. 6PALISEP08 TaxID=1225660 RepID=UPI00067F609B|nr:site-specific integrase [Ruegeria sp. 6PALISEP08]